MNTMTIIMGIVGAVTGGAFALWGYWLGHREREDEIDETRAERDEYAAENDRLRVELDATKASAVDGLKAINAGIDGLGSVTYDLIATLDAQALDLRLTRLALARAEGLLANPAMPETVEALRPYVEEYVRRRMLAYPYAQPHPETMAMFVGGLDAAIDVSDARPETYKDEPWLGQTPTCHASHAASHAVEAYRGLVSDERWLSDDGTPEIAHAIVRGMMCLHQHAKAITTPTPEEDVGGGEESHPCDTCKHSRSDGDICKLREAECDRVVRVRGWFSRADFDDPCVDLSAWAPKDGGQ